MSNKQTGEKLNPLPKMPSISRFDKRAQNTFLKDTTPQNKGVKGAAPQFRINQHKGS